MKIFVIGVPKASTTSLHDWIRAETGLADLGVKEAGVLLLEGSFDAARSVGSFVDSNPWAFYSAEASKRESLLDETLLLLSLREPHARAESMVEDQRRSLRVRPLNLDLDSSATQQGVRAVDILEQSRYWKYWGLWERCALEGRLVIFDADGEIAPQLAKLALMLGLEPSASTVLPYRNAAAPSSVRPGVAVLRAARWLLRRSSVAQAVFRRFSLQVLSLSEIVGGWTVRVPGRRKRDATLVPAGSLDGPEWKAFAAATEPFWLDGPPRWLAVAADAQRQPNS